MSKKRVHELGKQLKEQGIFGIVTPPIIGVFVLLAAVPLVVRFVLRRRH